MARRTLATLAIVATVFVVSIALNIGATTNTAAQQNYYALALSSGPELQLLNRVREPRSEQGSGLRLVCKYVVDVGVAKIGTQCAGNRRRAEVAQR